MVYRNSLYKQFIEIVYGDSLWKSFIEIPNRNIL